MGTPSTDAKFSKRRRARTPQPTDARTRLIDAALTLMTDRPYERISARAIATEAGVDPALVTYHFGGRQGLVVTVAEQAAAMLRARMTLGYGQAEDIGQAIRQATSDPVGVLAQAPLLAQLYVSELLLHGTKDSWRLLVDMAEPYFGEIDKVVEGAVRRRELRDVDMAVLYQSIAAMSLMPSFLGPLERRRGRALPLADPQDLVAAMVDVVLDGVTGNAGGRSSRRRKRAKTVDCSQAESLVQAGIDLLRRAPNAELTVKAVAAVAEVKVSEAKAVFPDTTALAVAVARAAVRAMPETEERTRTRGRPSVTNPALERDLVTAATELLSAEGERVTANAVAARAGCDPALVTYYFKGRKGLLLAVAARVLADLVERFDLAYDESLPVSARLEHALREPLRHLAATPSLARFLADEFLVHGTAASDETLGAVLAPFFDRVLEDVAEGLANGDLRNIGEPAAFCGLGLLPLYLVVAAPVFGRALGGPQIASADTLVDQVLDIVLRGIRTDAGRRAAAR